MTARAYYLNQLGLTNWQPRHVQAVDEPVLTPAVADDSDNLVNPASTPANDLATLDLSGLEAYLNQCDHRGATQPVFGIGAAPADVLIIGEAPGQQEDLQGLPFVGPSGQLLDRMLATIDCSRQINTFITNICKFRPPHNRDPNAEEIAADWPILLRQIELLQPKIIVAVGRIAAQTLLQREDSLDTLRGVSHQFVPFNIPLITTYPPADLRRSPQSKAKAWADLKRIAQCLQS